MKMAVHFFFLTMVVSVNTLAAVYNKDVWWARDKGAEFDVVFRVVDDEGNPVAGARCGGWIYMERDRDHGCGYAEYTDTNGCVRIVGKCSEWFSVVVRKEGYYRTMFDQKYPAQGASPSIVDGRWPTSSCTHFSTGSQEMREGMDQVNKLKRRLLSI